LPATDLSIHAVLRATGVNGSAVTTVLAIGLSSESIDVLRRRARGKSGRHRLVYLDPASLTPFGVRRLPEALRRKVQDPEHAGPIELEDLLRLGSKASLMVVIGLFIWAQIDDQRQCSFVTGYPGPPGFQDHEDIPGRMHAGCPVSE
jgi:hypothetical protein